MTGNYDLTKIIKLFFKDQNKEAISLVDEMIFKEENKRSLSLLKQVKSLLLMADGDCEQARELLKEIIPKIQPARAKEICQEALVMCEEKLNTKLNIPID